MRIHENIREHLANAPDTARRHGMLWYATARRTVEGMARRHDVPLTNALAAFAALSPRVPYARNVILLGDLLTLGRAATLRNAEREALRVLATGDRPKGRKVGAFFDCLTGDPDAVCLDTWALRAADVGESPSDTVFEEVANAYRDAARTAGILPSQCQAIVWCSIRGAAW